MFVKTHKAYYISTSGEIKECFVTICSTDNFSSKEIIKHLKPTRAEAKRYLKYLKS